MPTLFVSTTGGHLTQLFDMADRVPNPQDDRVWVTHDNPQSRSLLAHEDVVFVPYIGVKDLRGVVASLPHARRLLRERRVDRAVSTGSGIAVGYLPYLAARGVATHYIESAARSSGPSLAGRLLGFTPQVNRYTQYRPLAGKRWHYVGSVFDGFVPGEKRKSVPIRRAVVTIGTAEEFPFRRAIEVLAPLLGPGGTVEQQQGSPVETLWQTGPTPTDGLGITARPWLPAAELAGALTEADLVVSHAGAGSALSALRAGRCPVLIPREAAHGEVGDDHQGQLASALHERGLAVHRRVGEVTERDLFCASTRSVQQTAYPPTLALVT